MKRADIEVGKTYSAKVRWAKGVIVRVLALDVERPGGYGKAPRRDGVRVVNVQPFIDFSRTSPAGTEYVIATRDLDFEWTDAHQQAKEAREAETALNERRATAVEEALIARGITERVRVNADRVTLSLAAAERLLGIEDQS